MDYSSDTNNHGRERERTYEEMGENTDVQTGCLSKPNMEYNSDTNNQGRERENI